MADTITKEEIDDLIRQSRMVDRIKFRAVSVTTHEKDNRSTYFDSAVLCVVRRNGEIIEFSQPKNGNPIDFSAYIQALNRDQWDGSALLGEDQKFYPYKRKGK